MDTFARALTQAHQIVWHRRSATARAESKAAESPNADTVSDVNSNRGTAATGGGQYDSAHEDDGVWVIGFVVRVFFCNFHCTMSPLA